MRVPVSGGVYRYGVDGIDYVMEIIDYSMFMGPCTVKVCFDDIERYLEIKYNDLLKFINFDFVSEDNANDN